MSDHLLDAARTARSNAYSPYSGFDAGAAVETRNGAIISGAVVENISLGLAMCAERVAMFATIAAGGIPRRLALAAPDTADGLTLPCGACLQVALELGGPTMEIVATDESGDIVERHALAALLPRAPHQPATSPAR